VCCNKLPQHTALTLRPDQGLHQRVVVADSKQPTLSKFYNLVVVDLPYLLAARSASTFQPSASKVEQSRRQMKDLILKRSGHRRRKCSPVSNMPVPLRIQSTYTYLHLPLNFAVETVGASRNFESFENIPDPHGSLAESLQLRCEHARRETPNLN
jgi:hypothetical protein